jgi:hypothetical protein
VPQSTMPEALDQQITPDEMADLLAFLTMAPSAPTAPSASSALPSATTAPADAIAAALLDERHDQKLRETLARDVAPRAVEVIAALTAGLSIDADEEYRRIPWIWRVAVAAGRARDEVVLRALLDASMPRGDQPLRDWQAVVLGGGVVMGLSQADAWPGEVLAPWLAQDAVRSSRWSRSLDLAMAMADNTAVRNGTRYDALRMLAVLPWDRAGAQLARYLSADVDAELQAGAIGGLSDHRDERASRALVEHIATIAAGNRRHVVNALLRAEPRRALLREALTSGVVSDAWLSPDQRQRLASARSK